MPNMKFTAEPGKQEVITERQFDAPRAKVWQYFSDPDKLKLWWGGKAFKTRIEKFEPHPGGSWHFVQTTPDGQEFGFHGVIHDMTAPERAIQTFEFDGLPERGHVNLDTMTLTEHNGRTTVRIVTVFQSLADRDGMVGAGMSKGIEEGYNVLEDLLAKP